MFTVSAPESAQADSIARALLRAPGHPSGGLLLVAPLRVGGRWRQEVDDPEPSTYHWEVEAERFRKLLGRRRRVFSIVYRTLPDRTTVEVAPGLGIVDYSYEHHGTVAAVHVHLVKFETQREGR